MPSKTRLTLLEGSRECYDLVSEWIFRPRCACVYVYACVYVCVSVCGGRDSHVTIM